MDVARDQIARAVELGHQQSLVCRKAIMEEPRRSLAHAVNVVGDLVQAAQRIVA